MMPIAYSKLKSVFGLRFYKLMGSGKGNGFNPWPDWSVYALLQTWESESDAKQFFDHSALMKSYAKHTVEMPTFFMHAVKTHGKWSGKNPFQKTNKLDKEKPVAIITRATIKTSKLFKFWNYVPTAEKPIINAKGLLMTKGIGEVPFAQMATFSIWQNLDDMTQFAYKSKEHHKAIQMTRQLNWYSEELFARFQPYRMSGTWHGKYWKFD